MIHTVFLAGCLLTQIPYAPILPKLESYLSERRRFELVSVICQLNSEPKVDHLVYSFYEAGSEAPNLTIRTNFYSDQVNRDAIASGYAVPHSPALFSIPGARYTDTALSGSADEYVRLTFNNSVAHITLEPKLHRDKAGYYYVEPSSREELQRSLQDIARRYATEAEEVFPQLRKLGKTIYIRYAPRANGE